MTNENLMYSLIGGSTVALAWIASSFLTFSLLAMIVGFGSVVATFALAALDYGSSPKSLKD